MAAIKQCFVCKEGKTEEEFYRDTSRPDGRSYRCRTCSRIYGVGRYRKIKDIVFSHYGNACACCGEKLKTMLTLDHVNGGGNAHRRSMGRIRGNASYNWVIVAGFPSEYQLLCWNCNSSKYLNGGVCEHVST